MKRSLFTLTCIFFLIGVSMSFAVPFEVLVINGDSEGETNEAPVVMSKTDIEGNTFAFTQLNIGPGSNRPPSGAVNLQDVIGSTINLSDYQIIWFTWNGPGHDGSYFMEGVEDGFLSWVKNGGFIYMSAFDDNFTDANGNQVGSWMPIDEFPLAVDNTADSDVEITAEGESSPIFSTPNAITVDILNSMVLDDNFHPDNPDDWTIFATRADNGQPAVCYLPYGKGGYVEACIDARSTFPASEPLVENVLNFMASGVTAVAPEGKLSTTWGSLKNE